MAQQEISLFGTFVTAFKTNRTGAIIGLLVLACVFLATQWQNAESELRKCKEAAVEQEKQHSAEKMQIMKAQNEQWFEIGRLRSEVDHKNRSMQ